MKNLGLLVAIITITFAGAFAQSYDDVYYTPSDSYDNYETKVNEEKATTEKAEAIENTEARTVRTNNRVNTNFAYSQRIRRFSNPYRGFSYYCDPYTNTTNYSNNSYTNNYYGNNNYRRFNNYGTSVTTYYTPNGYTRTIVNNYRPNWYNNNNYNYGFASNGSYYGNNFGNTNPFSNSYNDCIGYGGSSVGFGGNNNTGSRNTTGSRTNSRSYNNNNNGTRGTTYRPGTKTTGSTVRTTPATTITKTRTSASPNRSTIGTRKSGTTYKSPTRTTATPNRTYQAPKAAPKRTLGSKIKSMTKTYSTSPRTNTKSRTYSAPTKSGRTSTTTKSYSAPARSLGSGKAGSTRSGSRR